MRVRVTEDTRTYWSYAIHEFHEGDELDGEIARHLLETAAPVELIDGVFEQAPPPGPAATTASGDGADSGSAGGEGGPDSPVPTGDQPPVDGTIDTLMAWIGGNPDRALAALEAEEAKDKPRSTVVKRLSALAATE